MIDFYVHVFVQQTFIIVILMFDVVPKLNPVKCFFSEFDVADPSEHKYFLSRKKKKKSEEYTTGRFWIYVKHSFIHIQYHIWFWSSQGKI